MRKSRNPNPPESRSLNPNRCKKMYKTIKIEPQTLPRTKYKILRDNLKGPSKPTIPYLDFDICKNINAKFIKVYTDKWSPPEASPAESSPAVAAPAAKASEPGPATVEPSGFVLIFHHVTVFVHHFSVFGSFSLLIKHFFNFTISLFNLFLFHFLKNLNHERSQLFFCG